MTTGGRGQYRARAVLLILLLLSLFELFSVVPVIPLLLALSLPSWKDARVNILFFLLFVAYHAQHTGFQYSRTDICAHKYNASI